MKAIIILFAIALITIIIVKMTILSLTGVDVVTFTIEQYLTGFFGCVFVGCCAFLATR